jgi:hypothetical protein
MSEKSTVVQPALLTKTPDNPSVKISLNVVLSIITMIPNYFYITGSSFFTDLMESEE